MKKKLGKLNYDKETLLRLDRMFFIYLKMCIAQERPDVSKNEPRKSIEIIDRVCRDMVVNEAIIHYPVGKLGMKQQVFLKLIRYKLSKLLYMLSSKQII